MGTDTDALNAAFENENFHHVAVSKETNGWRRYAALGLCGAVKPALDGLARFDNPEARFPGVSVSQVARRYDVNAYLVFRWLRDPRFNQAGGRPCHCFIFAD